MLQACVAATRLDTCQYEHTCPSWMSMYVHTTDQCTTVYSHTAVAGTHLPSASHGQCSEVCGTLHGYMLVSIIVVIWYILSHIDSTSIPSSGLLIRAC